jgi:hypothetical protein
MNLLGAGGGAKEAGGAMQIVVFGFGGKGCVLGVRVRFALKGGQKIFNSRDIFSSDSWHKNPLNSVQEPTAAEEARL